MIEYIDIYKSFDHPVLAGVNLTVDSGEMVAIFGPSGTGKSVLLKTTIGLIVPDRGDVRIDGESVYRTGAQTMQRLRRKTAYVFQHAALFDSWTVFENVAQGLPEQMLQQLHRRELLHRVCEALELVNLIPAQVLPKRPAELSGGMRKRVGLARAIIGRPQILLYDEPVTGLDPVNAAVVNQMIEQLAEELGVTSVIVTHDVPGALALVDRAVLLEGGRIRFAGSPDEFRASPDPVVRAFLGEQAVSPELLEVG